jgi:hypothetical protein
MMNDVAAGDNAIGFLHLVGGYAEDLALEDDLGRKQVE